jgi:hypothetical protein
MLGLYTGPGMGGIISAGAVRSGAFFLGNRPVEKN